jgi:hypothetical protein
MASEGNRPIFSDSYAAQVALQIDAIERRLVDMDVRIRETVALVERYNANARSFAIQSVREEAHKVAVDWKMLDRLQADNVAIKEQLSHLSKSAAIGFKRLEGLVEKIDGASETAEVLSGRLHELEKKPVPPSKVWWIAWGAAAAIVVFVGLKQV